MIVAHWVQKDPMWRRIHPSLHERAVMKVYGIRVYVLCVSGEIRESRPFRIWSSRVLSEFKNTRGFE